jgi:hypothetical protein
LGNPWAQSKCRSWVQTPFPEKAWPLAFLFTVLFLAYQALLNPHLQLLLASLPLDSLSGISGMFPVDKTLHCNEQWLKIPKSKFSWGWNRHPSIHPELASGLIHPCIHPPTHLSIHWFILPTQFFTGLLCAGAQAGLTLSTALSPAPVTASGMNDRKGGRREGGLF